MTAYVVCLTSSGGIPLFARKKGDGDPMTFSKMASLNGIHMFLKTHDIELLNADMPDTTVSWKEFKDYVTLIAIASGTTKQVLDRFLNAVFDTMVLIVGLNEIRNPRSIERLKRDLRACNVIIDKLLECLDICDKLRTRTDLLDMTEFMYYENYHTLQNCLDNYMEYLDSLYGCVLVGDCLITATENWWLLNPIERKLLTLAITAETNSTARDLPVYLPIESPNLAYRLVSVTLVGNVKVIALCGPGIELIEIENMAVQCWKNSMESLRASQQDIHRNFPSTLSLDSSVLGFLFVNYKIGKYMMTRNSQHSKNRISGVHRLDILRTFYHQAAETFLLSADIENQSKTDVQKNRRRFEGAKETYWCSEYHKCHAVKSGDHIFCVLYTSAVPTQTIRLITQKTLKMLLADKQVYW